MKSDYIDALRYGVDYNIHCLGHWNIEEENNMEIPGKLRDELKRIFGTLDPLNYIEDIRHHQNISAQQDELVVTLRVPAGADRFLRSSPLFERFPYAAPSLQEMACQQDIMMGLLCPKGVPKAPEEKPEKKIDPMEAVVFLKPTKIIYSGPKTIAIWPDGTKTIVSLMEGQEHDEYGAFCAAVVKKMFGATHKAKKFLETVAERPQPKVKKIKEATEVDEQMCVTPNDVW